MKSTIRRRAFIPAIILVSLGAGTAYAAPRSFSSNGVVTLTKTWGPTWGDKSVARLSAGISSTSAFQHQQTGDNFIYTSSYTDTWADAYIFNSKTTFWEINGQAFNVRLGPGTTSNPESPYGSHASATSEVVLNNQTLYSLTVDDYVKLSSTVDSGPLGITKKFVGGSRTYLIGGVIPVIIGGNIWSNISVESTGISQQYTSTGSSDPNRAVDASWSGLYGTGRVWGDGFICVGIDGVADA